MSRNCQHLPSACWGWEQSSACQPSLSLPSKLPLEVPCKGHGILSFFHSFSAEGTLGRAGVSVFQMKTSNEHWGVGQGLVWGAPRVPLLHQHSSPVPEPRMGEWGQSWPLPRCHVAQTSKMQSCYNYLAVYFCKKIEFSWNLVYLRLKQKVFWEKQWS